MSLLQSITTARRSGPEPQPDGTYLFTFVFGDDDPTFAGHFPGRPLLPGIFQIEIARWAAATLLQTPLQISEIVKAKFLRPIIPEETLRVELKIIQEPDTIQARAGFSVTGQSAGEVTMKLIRNQ